MARPRDRRLRDDGKPDRRHVERKTRAEVTAAVRELERERDARTIRKAGRPWTVKTWLTHWIESIAPLAINENTMVGYGVAVRKHLIPALGAHRLDKLKPEYIEASYGRMVADGRKAGTIHQIHRTLRTALNEAVRRGHPARNPVQRAKAPRASEEEVEPNNVEEVQRLLRAADDCRNSARWAVALALGFSQGEALGQCQRTNPDTADTKSRAGRRAVGLPSQFVDLLRTHQANSRPNGRRPASTGRTKGGSSLRRFGGAHHPGRTTTTGRGCLGFPSGPSWVSWGGPPPPWPRRISTWSTRFAVRLPDRSTD